MAKSLFWMVEKSIFLEGRKHERAQRHRERHWGFIDQNEEAFFFR